MNYKGFLKRIRSLRDAKDVKQKQMAKIINVERSVYTRKEKGQVPITVDELFSLATALSMTPEDLLSDAPLHVLSRRIDSLLHESKGTPLYDIIVNQIDGLTTLFESQLHTSINPDNKKAS